MDRYTTLRSFVLVADCGSFAAAAHKDQCILLHLISSPGWSRVNTISIDPPQAAIAASSFLPSAEKCSR